MNDAGGWRESKLVFKKKRRSAMRVTNVPHILVEQHSFDINQVRGSAAFDGEVRDRVIAKTNREARGDSGGGGAAACGSASEEPEVGGF